jgi:hypothetical protein
LNLSGTNQYFIIGGDNVVLNGNYYTVNVTVANYPGLVRNGSSAAGYNNCTIEKIKVNAQASSLAHRAGWIGAEYFSRGCTSTISECSSNGDITQAESGGIVGKNAACVNGNLTITKCFTTGSCGNSSTGLITGSLAANAGGTVTISSCFSAGNVGGFDNGGIFGVYAGNGTTPGTLNVYNSFTIGNNNYTGYGTVPVGAYIRGILNIYNCYFITQSALYSVDTNNPNPRTVVETFGRDTWIRDDVVSSVGSFAANNPNNTSNPWDTKSGNTVWKLLWDAAVPGSGAAVPPPTGLSYAASPFTLTKGTTMTSASPTVNGGPVDSWSISNTLPSGLSFDTSTGEIS